MCPRGVGAYMTIKAVACGRWGVNGGAYVLSTRMRTMSRWSGVRRVRLKISLSDRVGGLLDLYDSAALLTLPAVRARDL